MYIVSYAAVISIAAAQVTPTRTPSQTSSPPPGTCTGTTIAMMPFDDVTPCAPAGITSTTQLLGNRTYCAFLWGDEQNCNLPGSVSNCYANSMANPSGSSTPSSGCFFARAAASPGFLLRASVVFAQSGDPGSPTKCSLSMDGGGPVSVGLGTYCAGNCNLGATGGSAVVGMQTIDPAEYGAGCLYYFYSLPCPAGSWCGGGSPAVLCPVGSYCPAGSSAPTLCPAGTFGNASGLSLSNCSGSCPNCCSAGSTALLSTCSQSASPTPSQTRTPSTTGTQTPSITLTRTASQSQSPTTTLTPSQSASATVTPSVTQSASSAVTPSGTQSASSTATPSVTQSATLSATPSASRSSSTSATPSVTQTATSAATASSTLSASPTATPSGTQTLSSVPSPSGSQGASRSSTATPSATQSRSATPSSSESISSSSTASPTVFLPASPSPSPLPPSSSASSSASLSVSPTVSETPSSGATRSSSGFPLASSSSSASASASASGSASVSQTSSQAASRSSSATGTPSSSRQSRPPASPRPSPSQSLSGSPTVRRSVSASSSRSAAALSSASQRRSESRSQSRSPSQSPAASASASQSQPETQSQQPTVGVSRSPTPSTSPSSTPIPYSIVFLQPSGGGGVDTTGALLLSDSLPPGDSTPLLNRCPGVAAQLTVTLTCSSATAGNASQSPLMIALQPASTGAVTCFAADPAPLSGVAMPMTVRLVPRFGTPSLETSVVCNLTGADDSAMGSASLSVSVVGTLWPTFDDVIVVAANGFSRSVSGLGPGRFNSTSALIAALDARESGGAARRLSAESSGSSDSAILSSAVSDPAVVLAAVQNVWGGVDLPQPDSSTSPFSLTLFDSTPLVLRSRGRSFADGTDVFVGAVRCNGTVVSADGEWLSTIAPPPDAVCSGGPGSCAYATLLVRNPPIVSVASSGAMIPLRGAALACPPFCAGAVGGGVFPIVPAANATAVPATLDPSGTVAVPVDLSVVASSATVASIAASAGLFYSEACSSAGTYTDPSGGACSNASDPASQLCAFGGGVACRPCPVGALCPGGYRAWPKKGHWSPTESSPAVVACIQPAAEAKCTGWSAALSATQCGLGYRQGSFLCSACAPTFYLTGDGTCAACPVSPSLWTRYAGLFTLLALVSGFVFAIYMLLVVVVLAAGLSVRYFLRDVLNLLVHVFTILQVISNVAQDGSSRLPPLLRTIYAGVGLLQLQGITLPPACTSSYPFLTDVGIIGAAAGLWLAAVLAAWIRRRIGDWPWRSAVYVFATAAVYLHPTAAASALVLVNCRSVQLSASAVVALEDSSGNGSPAPQPYSVSAAATSAVSVIASNPFIPCFGVLHTPAGGLAVAVLVTYVLAMPILTFLWLWRDPWLVAELDSAPPVVKRSAAAGAAAETADPSQNPPLSDGRRRSSLIVPTAVSVLVSEPTQPSAPPAPPSSRTSRLPPPPRHDTMLHPFLRDSGYEPHAWYWRHLDIFIVLGLAAVNSIIPTPENTTQVAVKLCVTLALLLALALALSCLRNPYTEPWKRPVRLTIIALSAACACINAASRTLDLGSGGPLLAATIAPGGYAILGILFITVCVLLVGFGRDMLDQALRGARTEEAIPTLDEVTAAQVDTAAEADIDGVSGRSGSPPHIVVPALALSSGGAGGSVCSPTLSAMDLVSSDRDPGTTARAPGSSSLRGAFPLGNAGSVVRMPVGGSTWRSGGGSSGLRAWESEDGGESGGGTDRVVSVRENALVAEDCDDEEADAVTQMRQLQRQRQRVPTRFSDATGPPRTQSSADSSHPSPLAAAPGNAQQQRHQPLRHVAMQRAVTRASAASRTSVLRRASAGGGGSGGSSASPPVQHAAWQAPLPAASSAAAAVRAAALLADTPPQSNRQQRRRDEVTPPGAMKEGSPESSVAAALALASLPPQEMRRLARGGDENAAAQLPPRQLHHAQSQQPLGFPAWGGARHSIGGALQPPGDVSRTNADPEATGNNAAARARRASFSGDYRIPAAAAATSPDPGTPPLHGLDAAGGRAPRRRRSSLLNSASSSIHPRH